MKAAPVASVPDARQGLRDRPEETELQVEIADRQISIERNLAIVEERYRRQFSSLDTLVASFQSTGTFLTNQLAQIANLRIDNS